MADTVEGSGVTGRWGDRRALVGSGRDGQLQVLPLPAEGLCRDELIWGVRGESGCGH